jgi:hypothetical protein
MQAKKLQIKFYSVIVPSFACLFRLLGALPINKLQIQRNDAGRPRGLESKKFTGKVLLYSLLPFNKSIKPFIGKFAGPTEQGVI